MDSQEPVDVLTSYFEHRNRHDNEGALAHLAEGFEIHFVGGPTLTKQESSESLGWDTGANGRADWEIVEHTDDSIVVEGTETNDFLELLEVPAIHFQSVYWFTEHGLITRQRYRADWGDVRVQDAMEPAIEWAREHAPDQLKQAYPGGRMVYTEDAARRWVALLRRWRRATGG